MSKATDTKKLEQINDALYALAEEVGTEIDEQGLLDLTYVVAKAMGIQAEQYEGGEK